MLRKGLYFNLINIILSVGIFFSAGCTKEKAKKLKTTKDTEKGNSRVDKAIAERKIDKGFAIALDKLKEKNPFNKNHAEISKYKFRSGNLVLSGIFYDSKRPLALINDQMVAEGQTVAGKRVIKITQNEVILRDQEKEYRLKTE